MLPDDSCAFQKSACQGRPICLAVRRRAVRGRKTRYLALLFAICTGPTPFATAQSTSDQFWPGLNVYHHLNPQLRLLVTTSRSTDGISYSTLEVGSTLNIFVKRLVKPVLATNDEANKYRLVFGVGYRYIAGINEPPENRIELDFAPQFPLPWRIQCGDRNRLDLRFIEGSGSYWRYRNRLSAQRTFQIRRVAITAYAQGEVFYISQTENVNKTTYQFGGDFPWGKHFEINPYYEHDNNVGSVPEYVNAFGLTLNIYF